MTSPFPKLSDLSGVDASAYQQAEAYVMTLLKEIYPDRDFGYGKALYWSVVVPAAVISAVNQTNSEMMGASLSIQWIKNNPSTTDAELASAILSNYYQTLSAGAKSKGTVAVVVSARASYSLQQGTAFVAGGVTYISTSPIFAQVDSSQVVDTTDRLLTPRADGNWQFLVPVESQDVGTATFAALGTPLTMSDTPANFVTAFAASDISGGTDSQTVAAAAASLPAVFAAQTFGSRTHVAAMIAAAFPGTQTASIGFGDPEQWRDTHNLMQVQSGGMVDLYVATQTSIGSRITQATAELIDLAQKTWRFTIPREAAAGLYAVLGIVPHGSTKVSMPILAVDRAISIPSSGYKPLITVPAEAAFSAFQALTVTFTDTYESHAGLSVGATRDYDYTAILMPLVQDVSDYLVNGKLTKADNVLVRGAVPCVTRISLQVRLLDSDTLSSTDIASIKQAIVNKVASRGYGYGILSSSIIMDAIYSYLSGRSDVGANTVTLRGDIYAPTGEVLVIEGAEIRIPNDPDRMVTKNNTMFLTDTSRIDISLVPVLTP